MRIKTNPLKLLSRETNFPKQLIGGKAFNLQLLLSKGFLIPKTFVLDVNAISQLSENDISSLLSLESIKYAVRSSALSEDGKKYSYAGLFDSYLNVDRNELYIYICKCAASIENCRSKVYEVNRGIEHETRIGVIVQEMVIAEFSGVCFTVHPVLKDPNQMIIELAPGLGDKIVSGVVSPVLISTDKTHKLIEIISKGDFNDFSLDCLNWLDMIGTFIAIEDMYGYAVDIEWAVANGKLIILQARPITNLQ
jgi:rifampicin phosphotransferase